MTEFETYFIGINGMFAGAYCTHIFKKLMTEERLTDAIQSTQFHLDTIRTFIESQYRIKEKKESKTTRKKYNSFTIPNKLIVSKNK